jgi:hypothetical protein
MSKACFASLALALTLALGAGGALAQEDVSPGTPTFQEGDVGPRDLTGVSDIIVNVQTGTGNRIEFWDRTGTADGSIGKIRRTIDVGRLTKGR